MSSFGFRLICCLYAFFNISFFVYYAMGNPLAGDFKEKFGTVKIESLMLGITVLLLSMLMLIYMCKYIAKLPLKRYINIKANLVIDSIFLLITFFYFISVVVFSVGVSGVDVGKLNVSKVILYGFALLQPGFLIMIYIFCFYHIRSFLYKLVFALFLLTSLASGSTGGLIFIFLLWASFSVYKARIIFMLIVGIALSPIVRFVKYILLTYNRALGSGDDMELTQAIAVYKSEDTSLFEVYIYYVKAAFSRFEMVSSNSFIIENHQALSSFSNSLGFLYPYNSYFISKFIAEGYFLQINKAQHSLHSIFAYYLSGTTDWNAGIGLLGLAFIDGLSSMPVYIMIVFLIFFAITLSRVLKGNNAIKQLTFIYIIIVLWHGWILAFIYYAQALILFTMLILISARFRPYRNIGLKTTS